MEAEQLQGQIEEWQAMQSKINNGNFAESLIAKFQTNQSRAATEAKSLESRINCITDAEIKQIATLYYIERRNFQYIADRLFMDRTTVSKKLKRYFAKENTKPF